MSEARLSRFFQVIGITVDGRSGTTNDLILGVGTEVVAGVGVGAGVTVGIEVGAGIAD